MSFGVTDGLSLFIANENKSRAAFWAAEKSNTASVAFATPLYAEWRL